MIHTQTHIILNCFDISKCSHVWTIKNFESFFSNVYLNRIDANHRYYLFDSNYKVNLFSRWIESWFILKIFIWISFTPLRWFNLYFNKSINISLSLLLLLFSTDFDQLTSTLFPLYWYNLVLIWYSASLWNEWN